MLIKLRRRGQNTAEYAILIGLVIAAAVAMQLYVKRGLQARAKGGIEYLANRTPELNPVGGQKFQYEPYYANSAYEVKQTGGSNATYSQTGDSTGSSTQNTQRVSGFQGYSGALNND